MSDDNTHPQTDSHTLSQIHTHTHTHKTKSHHLEALDQHVNMFLCDFRAGYGDKTNMGIIWPGYIPL